MLVNFRDWVGTVLSGYSFMYGGWVETGADASVRYCVVQASGGPGPDVDVRRPRFRVALLGARNQRQDAQQLMTDANALVEAGMGGSLPCGAAYVGAISEPSGPSFTTEDRAWTMVDFEVFF